MIPFLLVAAVAYWLAAPDPVTAGARTASGTAAKAAGAGVRDHWVSGRDSRALTRTNRRDRWSKSGGFWRNLLRLEHGAVITAKGVKGAAGITRAAVRPVPAAVRAGWARGQERHRAKAGNRPVPVALDPPWWRREQPQVQPGEQAPEQVQVQPGNRPADSAGTDPEQTSETPRRPLLPGVVKTTIVHAPSAHPSGIPSERRCEWCGERPQETKRGQLAVCSPCGEEIDGQTSRVTAEQDMYRRMAAGLGSYPSDELNGAEPLKTDPIPTDTTTDAPTGCPGTVRGPDLAHPTWLTAPGGNRDVIYSWIDHPCPNAPTGPDGMCDTHRAEAGTSPAGTTPTEGDPMYTGIDELDNLTSVKDMAKLVADMAEESDFAQLVEFCKNASDETRDFGSDMAGDVAEFEEIAAKIGDLLAELADAAQKVDSRADELIGG